ncbi:MAG: hypothetical protein WB611_33575 [Stellaceae bacterium]
MTAAEKKAAQRRRQRLGQCYLRVLVQENEVLEVLIDSGRISEAEALCRDRVEAAISKMLQDWTKRWFDER